MLLTGGSGGWEKPVPQGSLQYRVHNFFYFKPSSLILIPRLQSELRRPVSSTYTFVGFLWLDFYSGWRLMFGQSRWQGLPSLFLSNPWGSPLQVSHTSCKSEQFFNAFPLWVRVEGQLKASISHVTSLPSLSIGEAGADELSPIKSKINKSMRRLIFFIYYLKSSICLSKLSILKMQRVQWLYFPLRIFSSRMLFQNA